jgi:hypothetical protein
MFCPNCKGEYVKGVTRCKQCDVPLVASLDDIPGPKPDKDLEFVSIVRTFNPQDIMVIRSILDDSGIEFYVQGENGISIRPAADPANVLVVKDRAEEALELLKDLDLSFYLFNADKHDDNKPDNEFPSEVNDAESEEET